MFNEDQRHEKLYDDAEVEVWFSGDGSQDVVISFSAMNHNIELKGLPAERALRANGYDVIGVIAKRNNWYPRKSLERATAALESLIAGYTSRICYGSSMGAYAALKYAHLLKADHTIAFAPQFSIDPKITGSWDKRYSKFFDKKLHDQMEITESDFFGSNVIVYDPLLKSDSRHAFMIAERGCSNLISGLGCGHLVVQPIASRVLLGQFFSLILQDQLDDAKHFYRKARKSSPYYRGFLLRRLALRYLKRHDATKANACIKEAIAHYDRAPGFFVTASEIRTLLKDHEGALKYALQAKKLAPKSAWVAEAVEKARSNV